MFFSFPSRSQIEGMGFFNSLPVPELWEWNYPFLFPLPNFQMSSLKNLAFFQLIVFSLLNGFCPSRRPTPSMTDVCCSCFMDFLGSVVPFCYILILSASWLASPAWNRIRNRWNNRRLFYQVFSWTMQSFWTKFQIIVFFVSHPLVSSSPLRYMLCKCVLIIKSWLISCFIFLLYQSCTNLSIFQYYQVFVLIHICISKYPIYENDLASIQQSYLRSENLFLNLHVGKFIECDLISSCTSCCLAFTSSYRYTMMQLYLCYNIT